MLGETFGNWKQNTTNLIDDCQKIEKIQLPFY